MSCLEEVLHKCILAVCIFGMWVDPHLPSRQGAMPSVKLILSIQLRLTE